MMILTDLSQDAALAVYGYLGYLLEEIVEALAE